MRQFSLLPTLVNAVPPRCDFPLGMQSGKIPDTAIKSSSDWDNAHRAANGRLNFTAGGGRTGGWSAKYNDIGQWFQIDTGAVSKIIEVATQGRHDADQWVLSYSLSYSQDGVYYYSYMKGKVTSTMLFAFRSQNY